jgi:ribonucleoside-diphosphate reductase alpha chain
MTERKRQRLHNRRLNRTVEIDSFDLHFTVTAADFPGGGLAEIFIQNHKAESAAGIMASDSAIAASLALQFGCPPETLRRALCRDSRGRAMGPLATALDTLLAGEKQS